MLKENLTFNDLPEMVGRLCEKIESLENALKESLAKEPSAKENLHVPMTVEEVCSYLGISKSSFYYKAKHGGIPVINLSSSRGSICSYIATNWTNGWRPEEKARCL